VLRVFVLCILAISSAFAQVEDMTIDSKSLYIIDGDSISLQMRIAGIDTPEIRQKCYKTKVDVIDCGRLSKQKLKELLDTLPGELLITPIGIDHYNRILVRVYKGDVNIGKLMVKDGLSYSYKDTYKQEQQFAKENKLGFWSVYTPPIPPYKWRKLNRR